MLRLLSWNPCEKLTSPDMLRFLPKQDATSSMSSKIPKKMKRKQTSEDEDNVPVAKRTHLSDSDSDKLCLSKGPGIQPASDYSSSNSAMKPTEGLPTPLLSPTEMKMEHSSISMNESEPMCQDRSKARLHFLRQTIQTQLSLEILLKHQELRLIDQELAKCQAAYEQLRRCTEIPYPVNLPSEAVGAGTGPTLRSSFSGKLPQSPAPWGVTDGPYTRHYAKWLIPDSRFDGGEPDIPATITAGKMPSKGRSTRGSFVESGQKSVKSRAQRSGKLKALPAGYGQPKEKASGPMILKRKSDGIMVKLVCPDCGRHDFGSAQGFINHCRIGHGRNFASHDAAAAACGEPVEYDHTGAIVGVEPVSTPLGNNVHPLIRSARLLTSSTPISSFAASTDGTADAKTPRNPRPTTSPDFRGSSLAPHLSALIRNKGLGLNVQDMVADAKTKVVLPESEDEDSDVENETPTTEIPNSRHPQVAGTKQLKKSSKSPATSPLLSTRMAAPAKLDSLSSVTPAGLGIRGGFIHGAGLDDRHHTQLQHVDPSPTSESTQAPSLIDDDEEFEPHSPASTSVSDENDEGDVDFEVQDDDEGRQGVLSGPEFQPSCTQSAPRSSPARVRRPSALRRQNEGREEKHVTFVSPSPVREQQAPPPGSDRKRRKISKS